MIEVRQVDAGREQAAAAIFRVLDRIAAQHGDVGSRIERGDIDRDFETVERGLVLGIEKARIAHGDERRLAAALERRAVERERAAFGEAAALLQRFRPRQQHGVAEMHAARRMREDMRQQQALIDLDAVLVALLQAVLARQLRRRRHQARHHRRGIADQMLDAHEFREIIGQAAIDRFGMGGEKFFARRAVALEDRGGGRGLRLRSAPAFAGSCASSSAPIRHCREKFSASRR